MRSLGKILLALLITVSSIPVVSAQQAPDMFLVEISPSSFDANTPVDMTIKAVKANGDIVKDYEGDVYIDVNGSIDTSEYTTPSESVYSFVAQDQGVKTFSKGLTIKKEGTFTVGVSDISDDTIKGEKSVIVGAGSTSHGSESGTKTITISSPTTQTTISSDVAEIIGSGDVKNSPFEILVNNNATYQGTTDNNGGFVGYASDLQEGENTVQVRIFNIDDTLIAESDTISFNYEPATDGTFNSIQMLPGNTIKAGEKVTFNVQTSSAVTSATIKLSNSRSAPMDMVSEGSFTKDITIDTQGKLDVSLDITTSGKTKTYSKISMLVVEAGTKIGLVRIFSDSVYKNKITLTWDVEGTEPAKYLVAYGVGSGNLDQTKTVSTKELILENLTPGTKYFFKVSPINSDDKAAGTASEIVNAVIGDTTEESCTVQGIKVVDIIEGSTHKLSWSGVQNVEKYIIYRSDEKTDIENMEKVSETTGTQFEYSFNPNAKEEKYTYYAVQAICKDGKAIVIDDVKKVKTGPIENVLLFVFVSLLFYGAYKLYGYNDL